LTRGRFYGRLMVVLGFRYRRDMRVLVCGDREWTDGETMLRRLQALEHDEVVLIEGEARGADLMAKGMARHFGWRVLAFPANWDKYHRAAGPIRNQQMLVEGKPDLVLAFHADIEHSKGTRDMVNRARRAGIPVEVITG